MTASITFRNNFANARKLWDAAGPGSLHRASMEGDEAMFKFLIEKDRDEVQRYKLLEIENLEL